MVARLQTIATAEGVKVENDVMAAIARLSEGCLRDAESLLGQVLALGEKTITLEVASLIIPATYTDIVTNVADALTRRDTSQALQIVNTFVEEGGSIRHFVDELMEFTRAMLFAALHGQDAEAYDEATLAKLKDYAKRLPASDLQTLLDVLLTARGRSTPSQYPQLPLEIAMVQFCLGNATPVRVQVAAITPTPVPARPAPASSSRVVLPDLPTVAPVAATPTTHLAEGSAQATDADAEELKVKWGRCVAHVAEKNISLPLMLNNAEVMKAENGKVIIGFPYQMHVDKMNEVKNLRLIEEAIAAVTMKNISIVFVHNKGKEDAAVSDLLEAFGGTVV
jgi:DNA polymerase-3 subunit gamma/tau